MSVEVRFPWRGKDKRHDVLHAICGSHRPGNKEPQFQGRKVGPSHIRSESGHPAKPVPVKPALSGPPACLPQLRRQSHPPQPEAGVGL